MDRSGSKSSDIGILNLYCTYKAGQMNEMIHRAVLRYGITDMSVGHRPQTLVQIALLRFYDLQHRAAIDKSQQPL